MSFSTNSFKYYSKEKIETLIKEPDISGENNRDAIILKNCINRKTQKYANTVRLYKVINLQDLQLKVDKLILPKTELVHQMSLSELTAYETMLLEKMNDIKSNIKLAAHLLIHLKIISNHLIYKFRIFE